MHDTSAPSGGDWTSPLAAIPFNALAASVWTAGHGFPWDAADSAAVQFSGLAAIFLGIHALVALPVSAVAWGLQKLAPERVHEKLRVVAAALLAGTAMWLLTSSAALGILGSTTTAAAVFAGQRTREWGRPASMVAGLLAGYVLAEMAARLRAFSP